MFKLFHVYTNINLYVGMNIEYEYVCEWTIALKCLQVGQYNWYYVIKKTRIIMWGTLLWYYIFDTLV